MAKVLLVEDDNNLREIFQMRLQAEGYNTLTAGDGEEALSVAVKEKPDLIIADVMMPKLSGFEMLETLRSSPEMRDTRVIMMTALGQAEDRARGDKLAVIKYLVKSQVTLEDFVRVVREVLQPDQAGAATAAAPATDPAHASSLATNNQESEKTMPDDNQTPTSPSMPDSGAPANPVGPTDPGAMGTEEEKKEVQGQMDNAMGAPAAPSMPSDSGSMGGGDASGTSMPTSDPMPPSTPPAPEPSSDPATGSGDSNPTAGPAMPPTEDQKM
jgi:CheY-like chemotaxis protein